MTSGELLLRGAEEPHVLQGPTRITGTNDDGVLTGVSFSTPTVHITQEVQNPPTTAEIDASFSMVGPATGQLNPAGELTVTLRLNVDLHIQVGIFPDPRDCRATPVTLTLSTTAPYDEDTGLITLAAPDFSIPAVGVSADPFCDGLIAERVNETLQGAGHSLRMTLGGDLTLPTVGEPTATDLEVTPAGQSRFGAPVTLTATVTPAPEVPGAPAISGQVGFFDGDRNLGAVDVDSNGVGSLVVPDLAAGARQLRARYLGAPPDWDPSTSTSVAHTVLAAPAVTSTLTGVVQTGEAPKAFDLTVVNTGFGEALDDADLRVRVARAPGGFAPIGPSSGTPRIVLRRTTGGAPTPVTLTPSGGALVGVISPAGTWDAAPGEEHVEGLEMQVSSALEPGPLVLTFEIVADPAGAATVLGGGTAEVTAVRADREATSITAGLLGFPPFFPDIPPITPLEARQGTNIEIYGLTVSPEFSGVRPSGTFEFSIDGVPMVARIAGIEGNAAYQAAPAVRNGLSYSVLIPSQVPPGAREVTVKYSGDTHFLPSQVVWPVTVLSSVGPRYECIGQGLGQDGYSVNVRAQAPMPAVVAGGRDLDLQRVSTELVLSRTQAASIVMTDVAAAGPDADLELDLGSGGSVLFEDISIQNVDPMYQDDGLGGDQVITLERGEGAVPIDAAPGTSFDVTLETISATVTTSGGFRAGIVCNPVGDPIVLGTVIVAGTTLTAEPGKVVAEGAMVSLEATALPVTPGFVEFRDGSQTIGVVPVDGNGVASLTTRALPVGERSLTARFFGGVVATLPSAPVELRVASCGATSAEGNGAVVRLVYLELLGRCPDAAGYEYWTGRLDAGASREAFARSISRTPEAVGRVVDDAYQAMLGRPADPTGRAFWTRRLQASGRYDQLLADLAASGEFWSKAGATNSGAVTRIYERLLGRSPDQGGLDFWVGRLDSGVSRRALVLALANSNEPLRVLVDDAYDEVLDREPTGTERSDGIAHLRSTGDRSGLYAELLGTEEFRDRAQGLPDPD